MKKKDKITHLELKVEALTALLGEYMVKDSLKINTVFKGVPPETEIKKRISTEAEHKEYQDWLNGISDKNAERDFNKGMLEADKDLQKVCNNSLNKKITDVSIKCPNCSHGSVLIDVSIGENIYTCKNCYHRIQIWLPNHKEFMTTKILED